MLSDQDTRSKAGDEQMLENMHRTKELGLHSRELLQGGRLEEYAELMHEHWEHKRTRSPGMTGGGGFLLVYTSRPEDTRRSMAAMNAPELAFDFEFSGAYASEYA
jgi:D-glycero-alpha-D-manno-heptose-7-phosphate kinase